MCIIGEWCCELVCAYSHSAIWFVECPDKPTVFPFKILFVESCFSRSGCDFFFEFVLAVQVSQIKSTFSFWYSLSLNNGFIFWCPECSLSLAVWIISLLMYAAYNLHIEWVFRRWRNNLPRLAWSRWGTWIRFFLGKMSWLIGAHLHCSHICCHLKCDLYIIRGSRH